MEEYITFLDLKDNFILNTFNDYHLLLQDGLTIPTAEVKTETEDIPGTSDILDYTEALTGDVHYSHRAF